DSSMKTMNIRGSYGSHLFRQTTEIIERAPECWSDLDLLLGGHVVPVGLFWAEPGRLELAGIAVRDADSEGRQHLRVSSPFMVRFLRHYYDERRLGDLYAGIGDWDKAFERYQR